MARSGLWNRVEGSARKSPADSPGIEIVRGEHALSRGQTKEGVALLEKAFEAMQTFPTGSFYLGSETLACKNRATKSRYRPSTRGSFVVKTFLQPRLIPKHLTGSEGLN
jgi:hypothetical protein